MPVEIAETVANSITAARDQARTEAARESTVARIQVLAKQLRDRPSRDEILMPLAEQVADVLDKVEAELWSYNEKFDLAYQEAKQLSGGIHGQLFTGENTKSDYYRAGLILHKNSSGRTIEINGEEFSGCGTFGIAEQFAFAVEDVQIKRAEGRRVATQSAYPSF